MQSAWDNQTPAQPVVYHHVIIHHMAFGLSVGKAPVLLQRFPSWSDFMRGSARFFPHTPCFPLDKPTFGFITSCWICQPPSQCSMWHCQTMYGFNGIVSRHGRKSFLQPTRFYMHFTHLFLFPRFVATNNFTGQTSLHPTSALTTTTVWRGWSDIKSERPNKTNDGS